MSKQDRQGVRHARDLEQKYTLGFIEEFQDRVEVIKNEVSNLGNTVEKQYEVIKTVDEKTAVAQATADKASEGSQKSYDLAESAMEKAENTQYLAERTREILDDTKMSVGVMQQEIDILNETVTQNVEEIAVIKETLENPEGGSGDVTPSTVVDLIYPVGSIYMSVNSVNPSTFFGGTWIPWGSGRVPVGVDEDSDYFAYAEQIGGEATHTLTTEEMPDHNHGVWGRSVYSGGGSYIALCNKANSSTSYVTGDKGGGKAHNNLQPYIACYMWKRTA